MRSFAALFLLVCLCYAPARAQDQPGTRLFPLRDNWTIQSTLQVTAGGASISTPAFSPAGWIGTSVPTTIVGALVNAGAYGDPFYGTNVRQIRGPEFDQPWWFRKAFRIPKTESGRTILLRMRGINYRADVWLNGRQIATNKEVVGPFRAFEFDVTGLVQPGSDNVLALEITRPVDPNKETGDLAIDFADWIPYPADYFGGVVNDVTVVTCDGVDIQHPLVTTRFDLPDLSVAHLTIDAEVVNYTDEPTDVVVAGTIDGRIQFEQTVALKPRERKPVTFDPSSYDVLDVAGPRIWWPWQLGEPALSRLDLSVRMGDRVTGDLSTTFGIRQVTSDLLAGGARQFYVNGKPILVRGAGWSPEMFLRRSKERQVQELQLVRDMGMNTVRFEGKFEDDHLYDVMDRAGLLTMTGWMCCGAWQYPEKWDAEKRNVAMESARSLMYWLRNRPNMLVWMNGSDMPPSDPTVERDWLAIEKELKWPNPIVATANGGESTVSGPSGVKMLGPYEWVPPIYWETDPKQDEPHGGAWGFATEISPGPSIPPYESLVKFLPPDSAWYETETFKTHAGTMEFGDVDVFADALNHRYGPSKTMQEFARKAQAQGYEGHRAMMEAYGAFKYTRTTGVIQWMLNNSWPGVIWHTYDYYLYPGGTYFGIKKALEPLHAQYSYDTRDVVVVNATGTGYPALQVSARVYDTAGRERFDQTESVAVGPDGVATAFRIPEIADLTGTYFLRLEATSASGSPGYINWYWLSTRPDVMDWEKTEWYYTPQKSYTDFTALQALPVTSVEAGITSRSRADSTIQAITLKNTGTAVAFMVHLRLLKETDDTDVLPVFFTDNYLLLAPGESRTVEARFAGKDTSGQNTRLEVAAWNLDVRQNAAGSPGITFKNEGANQ